MAFKETFSAEEWVQLQQAPMAAGMLITMASPSLTDSVKESMAVAGKIADLVKSKSADGLLGELLAEFTDMSTFKQAQPKFDARDMEKLRSEMLETVSNAVVLADSKASAGAASYKQFIYDVSVAAAEAAKEGDFMGIGGVKVSDEEKAALAKLANVLGIAA